ncbi:hypothetical protein E2562_031691 [Oryza meyeriana var. granulata]|uniref:Uncharacterized protein n=1 Tax=Oryza meyeriana var. granulata TaxID=110450 RepID=A0A6G1E415_9ORYZ|nr:hypothetical protein E2562_031691 [Oryza meyeriana var. granulata]
MVAACSFFLSVSASPHDTKFVVSVGRSLHGTTGKSAGMPTDFVFVKTVTRCARAAELSPV